MKIFKVITDFFKGLVEELKKVNWPTRKEVINMSLTVIISVAVAIVLIGLIDFGYSRILEIMITKQS